MAASVEIIWQLPIFISSARGLPYGMSSTRMGRVSAFGFFVTRRYKLQLLDLTSSKNLYFIIARESEFCPHT
jgi:hypothetical protein